MKKSTRLLFDTQMKGMWNSMLAVYGYRWLETKNVLSQSVKNYMESYNQIQLVFNYHTNLHVQEDLRRMNGMTTYGIDIPLEYFRYPYLNDPRQIGDIRIEDGEASLLSDVLETSKKRLHYGKDESVIDELESRFEFLTLYSMFEGFCESFLIEKDVGYSSDPEKVTKRHGDFVRNNNLLTIIKKIFSYYNLDIYEAIRSLQNEFEGLIRLFYSLRNLYTHRNGIVTKRFLNQGLENPPFLEFEFHDKEKNKDIYSVFCLFGGYYTFENDNFNCQIANAHFRAIALLIVELLNCEET